MYKKAVSALALVNLLFLFGFICLRGTQINRLASEPAHQIKADESLLADSESSSIGIVYVAASGQRVVDFSVLEKELAYDLEEKDLEMLLRIVEAEAGCEDEEGKLLVANVVLNRVVSEKFPDTVSDVVFQRENGVTQFSPVSNGTIWSVEISEETVEAVGRALEGEDISQGALYFAAREYADSSKMKWFDDNLTFLFRHGGHEFFR
nr:cell wall hydrolase [uncultured Acetatifactor sp.]